MRYEEVRSRYVMRLTDNTQVGMNILVAHDYLTESITCMRNLFRFSSAVLQASGGSSIALGGGGGGQPPPPPPPPFILNAAPVMKLPPPPPPHTHSRVRALPYVTHAHLESTPFVYACVCGGGGGGGRQFLKSFSD